MSTTEKSNIPQEKSIGQEKSESSAGKEPCKEKISAPVSNTDKERKAKMLACCWMGKERVEMKVVPKPEVTDGHDVILRVTGTAVCGSDLHLYHGEMMQLREGDILGHECMGIVEYAGPHVTKFKPGDRVVAAFNVACGQCDYCKEGLYTACDCTNNSAVMENLYGHRIAGVLGYSHQFLGGFSGAQAEFTRILFADTNLLKVPEDVPDEKALYLSDIVPTSYHAVVESGAKEGDVVGVWGLGPIGLNVCQWLHNVVKVKRIIVVDNVPERLSLAEKHWGVEVINFEFDTDVAAKMLELVPKGLDSSIDCAGFRYAKNFLHKLERAVGMETDTSEVINEMVKSTKKFGTLAIIADYAAHANHVLVGGIMEKGLRLIGCGQAPIQRHWNKCLEYIVNREFDPTIILTHRFPFEQTDKVYPRFDRKEAGIIKTFLQTKYSNPPMPGTPKCINIDEA